jgi:hypothetical protein
MTTQRTLLVALVAICSSASAQQTLSDINRGPNYGSGHYSVLTGRTVGAGNFIVHPEIGYPAVSVTLLSGMSNRYDFGGRFTVGYSQPLGPFGVSPGLGAQMVMRWNWLDDNFVSLGGRIEPGVLFGVFREAAATLVLPFGVDLGFHPHPILNIALGADIGVGVVVLYNGGASFILPLTIGPGMEINLTDAVQLTLNTRFGGYGYRVASDSGGFGFRASIGLAFRT